MTDAEYHLTAERDELRRQVEGLRAERERWRQIPTRLTDEEREAVERAADWLDRWQQTHGYHSAESGDLATLRGLLARSATSTT